MHIQQLRECQMGTFVFYTLIVNVMENNKFSFVFLETFKAEFAQMKELSSVLLPRTHERTLLSFTNLESCERDYLDIYSIQNNAYENMTRTWCAPCKTQQGKPRISILSLATVPSSGCPPTHGIQQSTKYLRSYMTICILTILTINKSETTETCAEVVHDYEPNILEKLNLITFCISFKG